MVLHELFKPDAVLKDVNSFDKPTVEKVAFIESLDKKDIKLQGRDIIVTKP